MREEVGSDVVLFDAHDVARGELRTSEQRLADALQLADLEIGSAIPPATSAT